MLAAGRELHEIADGVDERNVGADAGEGDRRALVNLDAQAIRDEAHDTGRFDPGNLLELVLALGERNEEDVAANIAAHDIHDLGVRDVLDARDFDQVAGIDAKAPGMLAITIESGRGEADKEQNGDREGDPLQADGGFLGKRSAANGDALLGAQEGRFLFRFEV